MAVCAHCGTLDRDTRQIHVEEDGDRLSFCNRKCYNDWQEAKKPAPKPEPVSEVPPDTKETAPRPPKRRGRPPKTPK